jgi:acyl-coenzyme A thioesterase PaaI-like protein
LSLAPPAAPDKDNLMRDPFMTEILPQLASGAAHTHALGFVFDGVQGDRVRLRTPWRPDLVGDPETEVLAGGLVTAMLDHIGGLAVWVALGGFRPIATLDLRVDYMRAARPRVDLLSEARCYRLTRSIGFVRAWAFEDDPADPVAAAQSTYVIDSNGGRGIGANLKSEARA